MAVKSDLILNMTPKIRSKNFQNCLKAGYHSCLLCIICELDPLAACGELFQAHVCCLSSTSKLNITVNENFTPHARSVKSVKATIKSLKINMEKLKHIYGIGKDVSRLNPKSRNFYFKSMIKEESYFQVERKPS